MFTLCPISPQYILDHVGDGEFLPQDFFLNYLAAELCRTDVKIVCGDVLFLICGWDTGNLNDVSKFPCIHLVDLLY